MADAIKYKFKLCACVWSESGHVASQKITVIRYCISELKQWGSRKWCMVCYSGGTLGWPQEVRWTTNVPFFSSNAILARETLPLSRCIPLGCARLQILRGKIFRQARLWCIFGIEPSCTRERVAVPSPFRGASKLPPNPPWSRETSLSPWTPIDQRAINALWKPWPIVPAWLRAWEIALSLG